MFPCPNLDTFRSKMIFYLFEKISLHSKSSVACMLEQQLDLHILEGSISGERGHRLVAVRGGRHVADVAGVVARRCS